MTCMVCDKEFEGKRKTAKYCSPRCSKAAQRVSKTIDDVSKTEPASVPVKEDPSVPLTPTDMSFDGHAPGYYDFNGDKDGNTIELPCHTCGAVFASHLKLTRFCSRDCQYQMLMILSGRKDGREDQPHIVEQQEATTDCKFGPCLNAKCRFRNAA